MEIKNKDNILFISTVLFILLCIIIAIVFIVFIWTRTGIGLVAEYNFDKDNYQDNVAKMYKSEIEKLLNGYDDDKLIKLINVNYLEKNNLSKDNKDEIINFLKNNRLMSTTKSSLAIVDYEVAEGSNNMYIYRFRYRVNGFTKYVNLLEIEPSSYTLSFEQNEIPNVSKVYVAKIIDNINFEVTTAQTLTSVITYNVKITNNSDYDIQFEFDDISKVRIILDDETGIELAGVVTAPEDEFKLNNGGSYLNQEFSFELPFSKQASVKSIVFYKVQIGSDTKDIIIDLK